MRKLNKSNQNNLLDSLLAQPAIISDRGFSKQLSYCIKSSRRKRFNFFLYIGICWSAISTLVFISILSNKTITNESIMNMSQITNLTDQLSIEFNSLSEIISQTSSSSLFLVGLTVFIVLSVFLTAEI